jgi:hypothetical protein
MFLLNLGVNLVRGDMTLIKLYTLYQGMEGVILTFFTRFKYSRAI